MPLEDLKCMVAWEGNVLQPHRLAVDLLDLHLELVEVFLQALMRFCANSKRHKDLPSWRKLKPKLLRMRHRCCKKFKIWHVPEVPCLAVTSAIRWEWALRKVPTEDHQEAWHCSTCKTR
mmetsp:Transcript_1082/g.3372  ORF Transcript_1082/g.3372 Transcript_1082/m.3372 type:complete len:119 (-) Transcript_1082:761-1117(-)